MDSRKELQRMISKARRALFRDDPTYYDMYENSGEQQLGELYLGRIEQTIRSEKPGVPLEILDAGCQAGRLAIPLALAGHQVTGVDTSGVGLRRAKRHARETGVRLKLLRADLGRWLPEQSPDRFDAALCAEVLYLRKNYRELLAGLVRVVKTDGLLFVSHRPSGYYLAESFEHRHWDSVRTLLRGPEGMVLGSYYNWQDGKDLERLYQNLPVKVLSIVPIGELNRLPAPEELDATGRDLLRQAQDQERFKDSGRYLLVSLKKGKK